MLSADFQQTPGSTAQCSVLQRVCESAIFSGAHKTFFPSGASYLLVFRRGWDQRTTLGEFLGHTILQSF